MRLADIFSRPLLPTSSPDQSNSRAPLRRPRPPTWRVEFTSNGVLIHGSHVEADSRSVAIHRAAARANAELAMRGRRLRYEAVVASLV